jgi:hypothetical protein
MGRQDPVRYKARDGLEIPALLTLPANGAKNAPLVVLVHGGPYVRGTHWGWNPDSQFLASRGYAVLEPEFRGSTGYGEQALPRRLEAMGPGDAERHRRRRALGGCPGHRRSEAHLHRRRQLRRLCHADGPGQRPRPVQVRRQLGRRHRHQPALRRPLELHLRHVGRVEAVRHAGPGRRPGQGCGPAEGHLADRAGGAHQGAAAAGLWRRRPPRADVPRPQVPRCGQAAQQAGRMDRVPGRGPRLAPAEEPVDFWSRVEKFLDKNTSAARSARNKPYAIPGEFDAAWFRVDSGVHPVSKQAGTKKAPAGRLSFLQQVALYSTTVCAWPSSRARISPMR